MNLQYADRPPAGYILRAEGEVAEEGDMAYIGAIAGRWRKVRPGMNIIGADQEELWPYGVLAIARPVPPVGLEGGVGSKKGQIMDVHVICCNDSVEFAVVGDEEKAKVKMAELRAAHYERNKWGFRDEAEHKARCYWHIHTVDGEQ